MKVHKISSKILRIFFWNLISKGPLVRGSERSMKMWIHFYRKILQSRPLIFFLRAISSSDKLFNNWISLSKFNPWAFFFILEVFTKFQTNSSPVTPSTKIDAYPLNFEKPKKDLMGIWSRPHWERSLCYVMVQLSIGISGTGDQNESGKSRNFNGYRTTYRWFGHSHCRSRSW